MVGILAVVWIVSILVGVATTVLDATARLLVVFFDPTILDEVLTTVATCSTYSPEQSPC